MEYAGVLGLEPRVNGFGDRRVTNYTIPPQSNYLR